MTPTNAVADYSTSSRAPINARPQTPARRVTVSLILTALVLAAIAVSAVRVHRQHVWQSDETAWRADHVQQLTKPTGWLTLIGLDWLAPGNNSVGTAEGSRVRLSPSGVGAGSETDPLASLVLADNQVALRAPKAGFPAGLRENGAAPHEGPLTVGDHPTTLTIGTLTMIVIQRGDRWAVRTKDSHAASLTGFRGLHWYAPDAKYAVTAKWTPYQPAHLLRIPTVIGTTIEMPSPGVAEFTLNGQTIRLEPVLEEPDSKKLFFILRDRTGRTTTDGAARFLYAGLPDHGLAHPGKLALDLNHLENPPCAYTPYATCPLPPAGNRLDIALPVGEQRYTP